MIRNKKGYSTGFSWIVGLLVLFVVGLLFIVFDQVFLAHLNPAGINLVNDTASLINDTQKAEVYGELDKFMAFWRTVPIILFFVVIIWFIASALRKGNE